MEIGNVIVCVIYAAVVFTLGAATRTSDLIYYDVVDNSTGMCFRRFNATHQIGCSSGQSGNVGIVFYASSNNSLDELIQNGTDPPYIVVMSAQLFEESARRLLHATDKVNGIVILNTNDSYLPDHYSPDYSCPNDHYGAYGSGRCQKPVWNPYGNGLMFENYPFPVVALVNNASVTDFLIEKCYEGHNKPDDRGVLPSSQRCGMLIKAAMDGAKDTPTCIRRSNMIMNLSPQTYCDPLGNDNIFATVRPILRNNTSPVIVVAARYDSFSMFDGQYPGAGSATLSFITLFAIAEAVGKVRNELLDATNKHIFFVVFHGEAFDYIGSSRMAYDMRNMRKGKMNFTVDDIEMFIEIGQIGLHSTSNSAALWLHSGLSESKEVSEFKNILKASGADLQLNVSDAPAQPLPPASLQTFKKERSNISGVVIANHEKEFVNRYYNSMFDVMKLAGLNYPTSLNETEKYNYVGDLAIHIQRLATAVAQSVYWQATGSAAPQNCTTSNVTVANLIYCFTVDPDCELLNSTFTDDVVKDLKDDNKKKQFMSHYVGVHGHSYDSWNHYVFARLLGETVVEATGNKTLCENLGKNDTSGYTYFRMRGPVNASDPDEGRVLLCMKAAANISVAVSPAFLDDEDYDWSSYKYSSWSESRWGVNGFQVRIFLMPSYDQQMMTFFVGLALLILSFVVVYFIERNSATLFLSTAT